MKPQKIIREKLIETIENQMAADTPKETKINFNRLKKMGYTALDAKKLLAQCLAIELFHVFKNDEAFNEKRYISNMNKLPIEAFGDE